MRHACLKTTGTSAFLACAALILCAAQAVAQNPKASQWAKAGGKQLLASKHDFTVSWTTTSGHMRQKGQPYWQGGFYLPHSKRKYVNWDPTVKNSVGLDFVQPPSPRQ